MNGPLFESARRFCVYSYRVGHGPLLLRSGKTDGHLTRISLLITDVRALEIRSWFTGITISETSPDYLSGFQSNPREMMEPGLKIYALAGVGWRGFVLGGAVFVSEDEAEFGDPPH